MESQKCRLIITNHSTHGKDARSRWMNQKFIKLVFLTDSSKTQRTVSLNKSWTEAKCQEMDDSAQEDHTCKAAKKELARYRSHWTLQLNDLTFNGPMALRDDNKNRSLIGQLHAQTTRRLPKAEPIAVSRPTTKRMQILRNISSRSQHWVEMFGHVRRLHPGGRVTNGMNGITLAHQTW